MNPLALAALVVAMVAGASPTEENPVLAELLKKGIKVSDGSFVKLSPPLELSGLDAEAQRQRIIAFVGGPANFAKMTAHSDKAPVKMVKKVTNLANSSRARKIDAYFIAYGKWQAINSRDFLKGLLQPEEQGQQAVSAVLTAQDLAKRAIKLQPEGGRTESYFFSKATILDRVELSTIQFSVGNRGPDWLLIASRIDPRFNNDPDFPNQWRLIPNDAAAPLGVPHVYDASGFYVKVTKLTAPVGEGAVFIEYHMVFEEPNDWFDGSSELSSKLDFLILAEAKRVRKKLAATPVAQ